MAKYISQIDDVKKLLLKRLATLEFKAAILRAKELRDLYSLIPTLPERDRGAFGKAVNDLKIELESLVASSGSSSTSSDLPKIDVSAPFDVNSTPDSRPHLLPTEHGTTHPLMRELDHVLAIFGRMGFSAVESRQLDDDWHMFESLNFPAGHPARDDYDTLVTSEGFIAPAHTSTMQNRIMQSRKADLGTGEPISVVIPGRVFRNEDLDARHEHTFYQLEAVYVDKGVTAGHLVATFQAFLSEYYEQDMEVHLQPFYFPFTEPSFEFVLSCPFCRKKGCHICSQSGKIELGGSGMIHPNVLKMAGIDPTIYTGFAWGFGIDRLVMMKYGIEDIRHFHSGKLDFLRQFV